MKRLRWLSILMMVAILAITGFQVFWLKENYTREQKSLALKAEVTFRETVVQLQASKFKLAKLVPDSQHKADVKVMFSDEEDMQVRMDPKAEMISTINIIRDKVTDSVKKTPVKGKVFISVNTTSALPTNKDSDQLSGLPGGDHILNLLYHVDSLQEPLNILEIDSAYKKALDNQKIAVPFTIIKLDSFYKSTYNKDTIPFRAVNDMPAFNEVKVGFAKPVVYRLELGNTFPFILKKISLPILFSLLLLGITIVTFVLLYRTLVKQHRLAALKNDFISNITHELKTPVATVGVAIEALRNFNAMHDPERTKEYLDISANELQRLSLLVDKVLKLSLFEKNTITLNKEPVEINGLIAEVINMIKPLSDKRNAAINFIPAACSCVIQADRLHMTSVLYNLLDNALKYSKDQPVIDIALTTTPPNMAEISIKDNGIGIAPEYRNKVFEKFFRVPSGDMHNIKGYGLGLSYVAEIIRKHHGMVNVESQPGKGSTFIIQLPIATGDNIIFDEHRSMHQENFKA
ncbi:MAG: GHKL domain-containing protein [Bacteroidetes bacterium]|nr:GHKL domain-containing protein [Bacteroidota bacterium]